jgi:hypothetical protein
MTRRNSGDEEIRRLLRDLNEHLSSRTAERLAAELRRREEGIEITVLEYVRYAGSPKTHYEIEHSAGMTADEVAKVLESTVRMWVERHRHEINEWLGWGDVIPRLEDEDWRASGLRLVGITTAQKALFNFAFGGPSEPTEDVALTPAARIARARPISEEGSEDWDERRRDLVWDAMRLWQPMEFDPDEDLDEYLLDDVIRALVHGREHFRSRADRRLAQELLVELTP